VRTVALIQARTGSTRFPGKVMADLGGRPLLALVLERAARAPGLDEVAVATTDLARDDVIAELCARLGFACTRGSEPDVLDRYHTGAAQLRADVIVRVTADCPLIDPALIGRLVEMREREGLDFVGMATGPAAPGERHFPDGVDCELLTAAALDLAWREATDPYDREHVTPFVHRDERLKRGRLEPEEDRGNERWTVDHPADLELVRAIVARLGRECTSEDILALLDAEPELRAINAALVAQPSRT
jgi:spore coat polysaccharide biosynthesis protein SpsF (cytidylyltransferase family)